MYSKAQLHIHFYSTTILQREEKTSAEGKAVEVTFPKLKNGPNLGAF